MTSRKLIFIAVPIFWFLTDLHDATADILILNQEQSKISGVIIDSPPKNSDSYSFLVFNSKSGQFRERQFAKDLVKGVITTIDHHKLESLDHSNPNSYLQVAEELSCIENDAAAIEMATRLTVLCIHYSNGRDHLRSRAVKLLVSLAGSDLEETIFRFLASRYSNDIPKPSFQELRPIYGQQFAEILKHLRNSNYSDSQKLLDSWASKDLLRAQLPWARHVTRIIESPPSELNEVQRLTLLRMEQALRSNQDPQSSKSTPNQNENRYFQESDLATSLRYELEDVFNYDLEANQFKNGRWMRPDK